MHNDRAKVDQHPARLWRAFDHRLFSAGFFEFFDQLVTDGVDLPDGCAVTQDKVIGQQGHFTHIQHHDIGCLFAGDHLYCGVG